MKFKPWIGAGYEQDRFLLLGFSAYSWMEDGQIVDPSPNHAIELVQEAIKGSLTSSFMNTLSRALTRKRNPTAEALGRAWSGVAFTNYIPGSVGFGPRVPVAAEKWAEGKEQFFQTLEGLQPRNVIVLGRQMWSMMPEAPVYLTDDVQGYHLPGGDTAICWAVQHPSAGLSWERLARLIVFARDRRIVNWAQEI